MGEFLNRIQDYTVAEIVAALGCPRGTAYHWREGKRMPPAWLEPILLRALETAVPVPSGKAKGKKAD